MHNSQCTIRNAQFMIKNLIFDFGNVLICYDYPAFVRTIFADNDELLEFERVVCNEDFVRRCDLGEESFLEIIRDCQSKFPYWERQLQEFYDRQLEAMTVEMPGMRNLLTRLRSAGYRLYGLTNWSDAIYPIIEKYDILGMMDDRLISSEERMVKPDVAIYDRLCEKFGLVKEECLFTDDRQANIAGARAAGMHAVLFSDANQYEKSLREYGITLL